MDNRKIKVRIKDTDEVVEVRKVGTNTYLDETNKEIYNSEDFDIVEDENTSGKMPFSVVPPEEFFKGLKMMMGDNEERMKEEFAKMMLSFKLQMALETIKKRPFMPADKIVARAEAVIDGILKKDKKQ